MNAKNIIAAVAILAATGSAFAQGNSEFVEFTDFVSTKTRAEVKAEIAQTAAAPEYVEFANAASATPRASLIAKTRRAYEQGVVGNSPEYVEHLNIASTRSRAEVRNEVAHAAKSFRANIGG